MRRLARLVVVLVAAGAGVLSAPVPAHAHAALEDADPPRGASLASSPTALVLTFTEAPDPNLSTIRILDSDGNPVEQGQVEAVAGRPDSLQVSVSPLGSGVYTVNWQTLSRVDGHTIKGAYALGVGVEVPAAQAGVGARENPSPTALAVASRSGFYLGLVALLGLSWLAAVKPSTGVSAMLVASGLSWVVAGAGAVGITAAQRDAAGIGWGDVMSSSLADSFMWRVIPLVIVGNALAVAALTVGRARRVAVAIVAGGTLAAMVGDVTSSHAAASTAKWLQGSIQAVHFAAAAVWIGGLGALLLATRRLRGDDLARTVRRYSTVAGISLAIVVATGVTRAVNEVGGWARLYDTGFGRLVLLKSALLLGLAGLGAVNRFRHVPTMPGSLGGLRRVGTAELGIAAVVLVATGLLVNVAPGGTKAVATPANQSVRATGADFGTTIRVALEATPGTVGPNRFVVRVSDYDTREPVDADRVALRFALDDRPDIAPSALRLERTGPGRYEAEGTNLSLNGKWSVTVLVDRGVDSVEVPLELTTRKPEQRVDVDRTPGLPTIYTVTLAGRGTVQVYLDPGAPGENELHVTFFDDAGRERSVDDLEVTAAASGAAPEPIRTRELSPGHFAATVDADTGTSRYSVTAVANGVRVAAEVDIEV
jgi:copper transport protein